MSVVTFVVQNLCTNNKVCECSLREKKIVFVILFLFPIFKLRVMKNIAVVRRLVTHYIHQNP